MKATEAKLLEFLKKSPQFVIPIYQRTYSWGGKECRQLWEDIIRTGRKDDISAHFVGSIVYVEQGLYQVTSQSPLLVIDGQQRLTTISLLIEALARKVGKSEPVDGFSAKKLRNYYLLNSLEEGNRKFKLMLSQTDRISLQAIVEQNPKPKDFSIRVEENFKFFLDRIDELKGNLEALCKGLAKLVIVDISLSRDQDNPQLIFESLNSTGRELSQADLIRNFVLMGLEPNLQSRLYNQYWRPMEVDFGQEAYTTQFDSFMRHYLTVKTGEIPNINLVYDSFKEYARSSKVADIESLISDIRLYSTYYCAMALGTEHNPELKLAFQDLRELKVDVAYPFLLELYHDYVGKQLTQKEFLHMVRLVESYVFRRAICAIPTNSLNKTFATMGRSVNKHRYIESLSAYFLLLPSYRRFPTDDEFEREIQTKDLYNFRSRSYWLRRLENIGRKERVAVDEYTIEHILPQNEKLSTKWQEELGPEWKRIQKTYLHTLGNLTLTGYNSEYSDLPFKDKRDMKGGFTESPLKLNQNLAKLEHWDEGEIQKRAKQLAKLAKTVWLMPKAEPTILETYKPKASGEGYTISDHPFLASGINRELFEAFRKEVLALDPCVTEEFLKLYIAYKAETNFVDVVPQAKRLRLALNMAFPDINDPKGICKDVSGLGRWGNGDVEVGLSSLDELPYVMGLVRQSFERQMGNNGEGQ
jgi:uncharacterized protein with ParB-like and HNH nuclease domain/predicted transport protein